MSESCKEHRPLLCDDFLDEEAFQYRPRQKRHMGYRGRASNNIRGAAAIIKNWPDHLTVSASFWWIGLGMVGLTIFIIYNTLLYASLPSAYSKLVNEIPTHGISTDSKVLPEVFMHIIVNTEKEANLYKYLPYINIVADKYVHYNFNLIVLFNDTTNDTDKLNHQLKLNNEEALNSLWSINNINDFLPTPKQKLNNIIINQINLSSYLDASPIRKYWKTLPHQFTEFLLRAVSIWEKGGIAFNPILLTPRSPHSIYIEKLYNLLETYQKEPKIKVAKKADQRNQIFKQKKKVNEYKRKPTKQVNNIRDIIDNFNNDHNSQGETEFLSEAENRQILSKVDMKPYLSNLIIITKDDNLTLTGNRKMNEMLGNQTEVNSVRLDADQRLEQRNDTKITEFLPSFLNFFFRDKSNIAMYEATTRHTTKRSSRSSSTNFLSNEMEQNNNGLDYQPMIIPAPTVFDTVIKTDFQDIATVAESENYLTIDLKGNLLSTRFPCHAFIGSVLNDVKHCGENESLNDFIISELSKFCKGLLSSCKGIDVMLL